jgi:caffeoyl-CoA O-methyltransferase
MNERDVIFEPDTQKAIIRYIDELFVQQTPAQAIITATTASHGLPQIDLRPQEGWLLFLLTRMIGAKTAIEFGTLAGYSATWIARGLSDNGRLLTLEANEHHAQVARENLKAAGVTASVEVRVGNAREIIKTLRGPFDLAFIDADKESYRAYFDWALQNVRVGGLILAHNAFRHGAILEPQSDENTEFIKQFNAHVAATDRVLSTIIPLGDGLLVALVQ